MSELRPNGRIADIPVVHGWRAVSILLVLACHWLPLPLKSLYLNHAAGAAGMALFFTLSGFLIVSFLHAGAPLGGFMVRRVARIVPVAWAAILVLLNWQAYDLATIARNMLFVANLPPITLLEGGTHLWSLGVEMQFYVGAALVCLLFGRKHGLLLAPLGCLAITLARIVAHEPISIVTWHRVDEILAGGTLALIYAERFGSRAWLARVPTWAMVALLVVTSNPLSGPLQYLRPYAAALLVGSTLVDVSPRLRWALTIPPMLFIAEISYALYVIHGVLTDTWLGSQPGKYLKRPVLVMATFALAYLSTRFFEKPISRYVRRLEQRWPMRQASRSAVELTP